MMFSGLKSDYFLLNYDKNDVNFVKIWLIFEDLVQNDVYLVKV